MQGSNGTEPPPGAVELREDVPLTAGGGARCGGGPRLVLACFGALSAAITLALLTQIYYGDYELVPHGSAASSAEACSRAGTAALKRGGRALDAALAAALCLAVLAPHRTSLDASGALMYWQYRHSRTQGPILVEWGVTGAAAGTAAPGAAAPVTAVPGPVAPGPSVLVAATPGSEAPVAAAPGLAGPVTAAPVAAPLSTRPPRLVAALAALHAEFGVLPWSELLQPAITLAKEGFPVSEGLAAALAAGAAGASVPSAGSLSTAPQLAAYLQTLQANTSAELAAAWGSGAARSAPAAVALAAGGARLFAAGAAPRALAAARSPPPPDLDTATQRVMQALELEATVDAALASDSVASGLAVVDTLDTYAALVTGLSEPFGSGPAAGAGWTRDEPRRPVDVAPAIMVDQHVCGTRYVVGAESSAALAQVALALAAGGAAPAAVERARAALRAGRAAREAGPAPAPAWLADAPPAPPPHAAVNVVQQAADALLSYADSRGGGIASRF